MLDLDYQTFEKQCVLVNKVLVKQGYFFRVYKFRKNFRYLIYTISQKSKLTRNLSSCITGKFNGFHIVRVETKNKGRKLFLPIDVMYDLVLMLRTTCYVRPKVKLTVTFPLRNIFCIDNRTV